MKYKLRSLYVCVNNMNRAITFYEDFLEQKAVIHDPIYSVFDINGFRFALFAYKKVNEHHMYGNNCIPSFEVESLTLLKHKISDLQVCFPLTQIGMNWVAEFIDSEGNHIEITAPVEKTVTS